MTGQPPWDEKEITLIRRMVGIEPRDILLQKILQIEKEKREHDRQDDSEPN